MYNIGTLRRVKPRSQHSKYNIRQRLVFTKLTFIGTKWGTFFETNISYQIFRILIGKLAAGMSKVNSTCPDESFGNFFPKKNINL